MIVEKQERLIKRGEPEKHIKYKELKERSNVVHQDKEKLYTYYICDFCGKEIVIEKGEGGKVEFRKMILALHNKCLNPMLKEFN